MANIILGVTGSIAAYKACDIIRGLSKKGVTSTCVLTKEAKEFVTPLTFRTLSGMPVYDDMFFEAKNYGVKVQHIDLARDCDLILIAPATANIIGKIASGIADDLLTTTVMASEKKVLIAPAMNKSMWNNAIVQENVSKLKKLGYIFIGPAKGELACGEYGSGHVEEPEIIVEKVISLLKKKSLTNKTFLITSGPTREPIDDVRFISNPSSGKTGYFLAKEAKERGAKVIFITGKTSFIPDADIISHAGSADDMLMLVKKYQKKADVIIGAAAVGDFTVEKASGKIERKGTLRLDLKPTRDILAEIGKNKGKKIVVGFSAVYGDGIERAKKKIKDKNLDLIVYNDVSKPDTGFESDTNEIIILNKKGHPIYEGKGTKEELAGRIIDLIEREF